MQVYTFEAGQDNKDNKVVATRAREYPAQRDKGKMIRLGSKIISPKRLLEIAQNNSLNGKSYNILVRNCQAWSVSHVFFLITYSVRFPCEISDGLLLEMPQREKIKRLPRIFLANENLKDERKSSTAGFTRKTKQISMKIHPLLNEEAEFNLSLSFLSVGLVFAVSSTGARSFAVTYRRSSSRSNSGTPRT